MNENKVILTLSDLSNEVSKMTNIPAFIVYNTLLTALDLINEKKIIYQDRLFVERLSDLFRCK